MATKQPASPPRCPSVRPSVELSVDLCLVTYCDLVRGWWCDVMPAPLIRSRLVLASKHGKGNKLMPIQAAGWTLSVQNGIQAAVAE